MKISVVLATYNGEKYISKQVESIMRQSRKPDEIIVSDDVSGDASVELCKKVFHEYGYTKFKIIQNTCNLGYKKNFHQAIKETTGDVIFLCDQDDIWFEDKLAVMEKIFERNDKVFSVNSGFLMIDPNDNLIRYKNQRGFLNNNMLKGKADQGTLMWISPDQIYRYNISPGCTMAFRKEVREIYLGKSKCHLPHDWELNLIAAFKGGLYFYNMPLIYYRIHEKNTLGMDTNDHISNFDFKKDLNFRLAGLKDREYLKEFLRVYKSEYPENRKQMKKIKKICTFDDLRRKCIEKHDLLLWLKLFVSSFSIWDGKYIRMKMVFGDLYYTLIKK